MIPVIFWEFWILSFVTSTGVTRSASCNELIHDLNWILDISMHILISLLNQDKRVFFWYQRSHTQHYVLYLQSIFHCHMVEISTWHFENLKILMTTIFLFILPDRGTRWHSGVIGIFHWHNPSGRTMALGSTQPLTEMSTRNISWGVEAAGM
jgi:hypothetical protein